MRDRFITVQCCNGRKAFFVALLFFLQFHIPYVRAQESIEGKNLSRKPLISQIFRPARNETEVKVILASNLDPSTPSMFYDGTAIFPIQSGLNLGFAVYVYEGRTPSGKQGVTFTFVSERKDTFKVPPAFSINTDGQEIQNGMAELPGLWDKNQQMITVSVPTDIFLRIAAAKKVQFNLGPKTYKPVDFQQKYMRALAKIIDPQGK